MAFETYSLFNVGEATALPSRPGAVRLARYPSRFEQVYTLGNGKHVGRFSNGCEIRFVPQGDDFIVHLSTPTPKVKVHFYQGDFWLDTLEMDSGRDYAFKGKCKPHLFSIPENFLSKSRFSPTVVRLRVDRGIVNFHGIDTFGDACRLPRADEQPKYCWLAWGSSITQWDDYGYIYQAANRLGVDVLNKGLGGSCGAEPEIAEWLVSNHEWDFATCEWGVNMRGLVSREEFGRRVRASLEIYLKTGKPIFLISPFMNDAHLGLAAENVIESQRAYEEVLRALYQEQRAKHPQLHWIEGCDILSCASWLRSDLVHPTHNGHSRMGETLARIMAEKLDLG